MITRYDLEYWSSTLLSFFRNLRLCICFLLNNNKNVNKSIVGTWKLWFISFVTPTKFWVGLYLVVKVIICYFYALVEVYHVERCLGSFIYNDVVVESGNQGISCTQVYGYGLYWLSLYQPRRRTCPSVQIGASAQKSGLETNSAKLNVVDLTNLLCTSMKYRLLNSLTTLV